jgi:hypothetical protein
MIVVVCAFLIGNACPSEINNGRYALDVRTILISLGHYLCFFCNYRPMDSCVLRIRSYVSSLLYPQDTRIHRSIVAMSVSESLVSLVQVPFIYGN